MRISLFPYGVFRGLSKSFAAVLFAPVLACAEPVTILALGDSLTQGYGLPAKDGFVPQMQAWLRDQGEDVVLINSGVSGDTTTGGFARIEWSLTPEINGLIVALGGNDVLRGIAPDLSQRNLAGILDVANAAQLPVLLVGIRVPKNYGPVYKRAFDAIYPHLAVAHNTLLSKDFLAALSELSAEDPALALPYLQPDGLHPNAAGVALIVNRLGPQVQALIAQSK